MPTVSPSQNNEKAYVIDYIQRALTSDVLEAPDQAKADHHAEALITLYVAHERGGTTSAKKAWEVVRRLRPELAEYDPDTPLASYKPDDDMICNVLAESIRDNTAFFHNEWKRHENGVWSGIEPGEFRRNLRHELRGFRGRGVQVSQNRIKALAAMLEDELVIPNRIILERQKEQTKYINLRNGLFNLETMMLEPHRPDLYFVAQHAFDYDPRATVHYFHEYLNSSLVHPNGQPDRDLIRLVKEGMAYSLTAHTDLKSSFWLVGEKDSGKSTMIALLKLLMGALHATIDLTQLGVNRFLLAGMIGKRVITFTEASSSTVLPDAIYKTLVGGSDEVYADVKNRDAISFRPEAKVWWAMNEMPRINDRSGATTRRVVIVPFNRTIPEDKRIPDLELKLAGERSGIFNLLIEHLADVRQRGGFIHCKQSEQMHAEYVRENDTEATYLEERTEQHESYRIQSSVLYRDYKAWCDERGFRPKNYNQIAKDWRRKDFTSRKTNGVIYWIGLRLCEHFSE